MEKVIRNGEVAVLISPGYGAGWYSWHSRPELVFHPTIVDLVEQEKQDEITEELCQELLGTTDYICVAGADQLLVEWLPVGTIFKIEEYDGAESISAVQDLTFVA